MTTPLTDLRNRPLEQWKVTELKDELKRRSITTKGVKDDLVRRLEEAFRNDGEKANSGSSQQTDSGMNDNNGGGSVNAENPNGNEETDMFQENQNPNRKDDDDEKCQNLNDGDAKGPVNGDNEDQELSPDKQEMGSSPKPPPPGNDVAGEELKAEDPVSSDALENSRRKDDGVAEKSDYSLNQNQRLLNIGTCKSLLVLCFNRVVIQSIWNVEFKQVEMMLIRPWMVAFV